MNQPESSIAPDGAAGDDEHLLARDMIDVHGAAAADVARDNARTAALAGRKPQARSWIRVLDTIQRGREKMPVSSPIRGS